MASKSKKYAQVDAARCVACGACTHACPRGAISVVHGRFAYADPDSCVGCGLCGKACPVGCITPVERVHKTEQASASALSLQNTPLNIKTTQRQRACVRTGSKKPWYQYLWIWAIVYFSLGFFNILFAWLGMLDFLLPLIFAIAGGNKWFCNNMCGRGQLFTVLGAKLRLSRNKTTPHAVSSRWFRSGFLVFFLTMFGNMVFQTYLVAADKRTLRQVVTLFWTFRVPWKWAYSPELLPKTLSWVVQFSYGFYSLMLTSTLIGLVVMALFKPRSWCTFCPMGTMTQGICRLKSREDDKVF